MAERVGIVGLGLMGQAYSQNLIPAGFDVQGFDTDPARMDELREKGGTPVESPAAAARGARWLITALPTSAIVREVALGPNGVAEGADKGLLFVDTSTAAPEESKALAIDLAERGIRFLDCPVSGTSLMAQSKDLIVMAAGPAEDYEACKPLFDGISRGSYHVGPSGAGALTKLIINLVLMGNAFALAEGLTLGMKAGLDTERILAVLKDGAAGSKVMDQKGMKMINADYETHLSLAMAVKDVGLMLEQGKAYGTPMMLTSTYSQMTQSAARMMGSDQDYSSFIELLREMSGMERRA